MWFYKPRTIKVAFVDNKPGRTLGGVTSWRIRRGCLIVKTAGGDLHIFPLLNVKEARIELPSDPPKVKITKGLC